LPSEQPRLTLPRMANPIILFGAGASFGSDTADTPPLGADLFAALQGFNPVAWGTITGPQATAFRTDFESAMRELSESNPHALPPLQRAMAAYFFGRGLRETNLYARLARRIRQARWSGATATLNYERLLEIALLHSGLQPYVGDAPAGLRQGIEIVLPHGCCHIFCDSVRMAAGGVSFAGTGITIDGPVRVIADPQEHRARILKDAVPPVMSYFVPEKLTTAGASFIKNQRERWASLTAEAPTIAVVGVRIRPHDAHIWEPLASTEGRVVYLSGRRGATEYEVWRKGHNKRAGDLVIAATFAEGFERMCSQLGLPQG
jgi:hypothetical protein